jgi:replicative DNA helicase
MTALGTPQFPDPCSTFDQDQVESWLLRLFSSTPGRIGIAQQDSGGSFCPAGLFADVSSAVRAGRALHAQSARSIYYRCTTVSATYAGTGRGLASDSAALPLLWSDIDFGTIGHAKPSAPMLPLPPDAESARAIVTNSPLPDPSVWVHSGGGIYALWLLDEPLLLEGKRMQDAAATSTRLQHVLGTSATQLGFGYGTGVGDLSRVLRVPGSLNRKTDTPRPCRIESDTGHTYAWQDLREAVRSNTTASTPRPAPPSPTRPAVATNDAHLTPGPFDVLARHASWGDLLAPAGFTFVRNEADGAELWLRPHDPSAPPNSEYSVRCRRDGVPIAVNFSEVSGLPVGGGHKLTHGRVFAALHHAGNQPAAARDLLAAAAREPSATEASRRLPPPVLDAIRTECGSAASMTYDAAVPPQPLTERHQLERFPVDALPGSVAAMVDAIAVATQTDGAMAGVAALGVLSACAGGRAQVEVRRGWREPVNVYCAVVAAPGERKSAVVQAMTHPLVLAEQRLAQAIRPKRIAAHTTREIAYRRAEAAKVAAGKAAPQQQQRLLEEAVTAELLAAQISVPAMPKLIADDITPEAAVSLLADQQGRLAVISAEGGLFETIAGRYSGGVPNLEVWLKGHAGDAITVDRKGRDPEHIRHPALTLLLMLQPAVLTAVARHSLLEGRGLLARFLFALPSSRMGTRRIAAPPVPEPIEQAYGDVVASIVTSLWDSADAAILQLSDTAHDTVIDFERTIEPEFLPLGKLHPIRDWGSKMTGATMRIAGLLHLAKHPVDAWNHPINAETVEDAIQLAKFFTSHAIAAFDAMHTDPLLDDAEYLLAVIKRLNREELSQRDMMVQGSRSRFRRVKDLVPVLALLEEHGYIGTVASENSGGPGRPASPRWQVHPQLLHGNHTNHKTSSADGRHGA